jgi:NADH-quinone oxidoreductase subunit A
VLQEYVPLAILIGLVVFTAIAIVALSHFLPREKYGPVKKAPYESGMPALGGTRERFSVKFYLIAILFIVFDLETVFMIPWAVSFRRLGLFGLVAMLVFVTMLVVGLVYEWKRGGLEWD